MVKSTRNRIEVWENQQDVVGNFRAKHSVYPNMMLKMRVIKKKIMSVQN